MHNTTASRYSKLNITKQQSLNNLAFIETQVMHCTLSKANLRETVDESGRWEMRKCFFDSDLASASDC